MTSEYYLGMLEVHMEVYIMALDVTKASTYQNNISPGGQTSVDTVKETITNQVNQIEQNIRPVEELGEDKSEVSDKHIKTEISKANSRLKNHNVRCEFAYHEETKRVTIKVFDKDTEEVIREIPPEKTLDMIQKMWELAGILVDERR
jgi:flagellar protein FlaG